MFSYFLGWSWRFGNVSSWLYRLDSLVQMAPLPIPPTQPGPPWRAWAGRPGIRRTQDITTLAEGARWTWKQAEQNRPGAGGLLDIYHASEHRYGTAKVLFGEGASASPA